MKNEEGIHSKQPSGLPHIVKQLPATVRDRLLLLHTDRVFIWSDFDSKALLYLQYLPESSQLQVIHHMESNRTSLQVRRSKSAFLVSLCERARRGALDVRGFGLADQFSLQLDAVATSRPQPVVLLSENQWMLLHVQDVQVTFIIAGQSEISGNFRLSSKVSDLRVWVAERMPGQPLPAKLKLAIARVLKEHLSR